MTSPETCYPHSGHWKGLMELSVQSNWLSASKRIKSCLSRLMHFEVTNWAHYHSSNIFGMRRGPYSALKAVEENVPDEAIVVCLFVCLFVCFDQCLKEKGLKHLIFMIKFEPNLMHPSAGIPSHPDIQIDQHWPTSVNNSNMTCARPIWIRYTWTMLLDLFCAARWLK